MMVKWVLFAAIPISTVIFAVVSTAQNTTLALAAAFVGVIWLVQEVREREPLNSVGFLVFAGLAALGSFSEASLPLLLVGLCADLVAWDLSRFRRRIREEDDSAEKARLERSHLQKLGIVIAAGLLIALIPALLTISVNFVVLLALMLIALLALRQSLLSLRGSDKGKA